MDNTKKKKASRKEAPAPQDAKRRPIHSLHQGDVSASVWARDHEVRGEMTRYYSVTFERSYKDSAGKYGYSRSFNANDLAALKYLCDQVAEYINSQVGLVPVIDQD